MRNKITGLKLEEIVKFDIKKFKSCIVRYTGECGGDSFEKEISLPEVLTLHKSIYTTLPYTSKEKEILKSSNLKELVYPNSKEPCANIIAKISKYDLIIAW